MDHRVAGLLAPCFLVVAGLAAIPACAQIQGRVADAESGEPVEASTVILLDSAGDTVVAVASRADGRFAVFHQLVDGEYLIGASAQGYQAVWTVFEYEGAPKAFEMRLRRAPVELEGLEVSVEGEVRTYRKLALRGFYDRQRRGFGDHLEFSDPSSRLGATRSSHLIRRLAGVSVAKGGEPLIRGGSGGACQPVLVIDGLVVRAVPSSRAFDDIMPPPEDILAIEVYRSLATVPPQWLRRGMCGAIIVWTR